MLSTPLTLFIWLHAQVSLSVVHVGWYTDGYIKAEEPVGQLKWFTTKRMSWMNDYKQKIVGSCPTCCNAVPLKLCGELWYVLKLFHIDILLTMFQMNCANLHRHFIDILFRMDCANLHRHFIDNLSNGLCQSSSTFYWQSFEWTVPIFDILLTIFRMDCANLRHFIDNLSNGLCQYSSTFYRQSFDWTVPILQWTSAQFIRNVVNKISFPPCVSPTNHM